VEYLGAERPMTYTYEVVSGEIHLYDTTDTELSNSPVSVSDGVEIPLDIVPILASEMGDEFKANGFNETVQELIVVLATDDVEPK